MDYKAFFGKIFSQSRHKLIIFKKTHKHYFKTFKAHKIYILLKKMFVSTHFLFKYHLKLKKKGQKILLIKNGNF